MAEDDVSAQAAPPAGVAMVWAKVNGAWLQTAVWTKCVPYFGSPVVWVRVKTVWFKDRTGTWIQVLKW
jgi:hypothetical protein